MPGDMDMPVCLSVCLSQKPVCVRRLVFVPNPLVENKLYVCVETPIGMLVADLLVYVN